MKNLSFRQNVCEFSIGFNRTVLRVFQLVTLLVFCVLSGSYAQAPHISYAGPQMYNPFVPITPLKPVNTGGAIPGAASITLGNLNIDITGMAVDTSGNVYIVGNNSSVVTELTGNTFVTFGSNLSTPQAIAVDAAGNIFIADAGHGNVKEIPAAARNTVKILFNVSRPTGIAVDAADNVYVATNNGIYKELAGSNTANFFGGEDTIGIAIDAAGDVFTIDPERLQIIEIQATTRKSVVLDNENLISPNAITSDANGDVYFADNITADNGQQYYQIGYITEIPAGGGAPFKVATGLDGVNSVAVDKKGNVFAAKAGNSVNETLFGLYSVMPALPAGLALDRKTGIISGIPLSLKAATNYTITGANVAGSSTTTVNIAVNATASPNISYSSPQTFYLNKPGSVSPVNTGGAVPTQQALMLTPPPLPAYIKIHGLAVDGSGNIYTEWNYDDANENLDFIQMLPPGGGIASRITSGFNGPSYIAVDAAGNVFVSDNSQKSVREILASNGSIVTYASGFKGPGGLVLDAAGNLYVSDNVKGAIFKVPPGGGTPVQIVGGLNAPNGIAIDASGNIYIANTNGNNVKKLLAGTTTLVTLASNFSGPTDVAVDAAGNVFVADEGEGLVKRIPVGSATAQTILTGIQFKQPGNIKLDASGNIYVADWSALKVYEINPGYFISPVLPAGLNIDESTGIISGTPQVKNTAPSYTVTAYNSGGTGTATLNLKIVNGTNTSLSGLSISSGSFIPAFTTATTNYNVYVGNATASVSFTPTTADGTATVTVNGTTVASGTASPAVALSPGDNTVHIAVDDNSGTTETNYTVTVHRGTATNANLQTLKLSRGTLSPAFNINTTGYTAGVANGVSSLTVTPTTAVTGATVTVNGTAVTSGSPSGAIALSVGANTINITVTATDGTTTKTYTVTVTEAAATNDNLSALKSSRGVLSPAFNTNTTSYTASVVNGVGSTIITPTSAVGTSSITVNGAAVASGTPSNPIALGVGANTITTVVTAQDGVTTKTYTLTINRASLGSIAIPDDESISVNKPIEDMSAANDGITVHQGISPNGDGINDYLVIEGIGNYPDNKLQIMNRNGALVYEAKGYDNVSKTFDGHSNKNGQMQLPGTYFYQLEYTVKGIIKHKTGYIVLKY